MEGGLMNVAELIEILEDCDPETEIRLASQPKWPFEYSISNVVLAQPSVDLDEFDGGDPRVVYIAEGTQIDYLSGDACEMLGWR